MKWNPFCGPRTSSVDSQCVPASEQSCNAVAMALFLELRHSDRRRQRTEAPGCNDASAISRFSSASAADHVVHDVKASFGALPAALEQKDSFPFSTVRDLVRHLQVGHRLASSVLPLLRPDPSCLYRGARSHLVPALQ